MSLPWNQLPRLDGLRDAAQKTIDPITLRCTLPGTSDFFFEFQETVYKELRRRVSLNKTNKTRTKTDVTIFTKFHEIHYFCYDRNFIETFI